MAKDTTVEAYRQLLSALQRIAELFAEREAELHKMKMEAVPWRLESLGKLEDSDLYDTVTQHDLDTVKVKP